MRGKSWQATIREQRRKSSRVLEDSPGLKNKLANIIESAYGDVLQIAIRETHLDGSVFPPACPWGLEQTLDDKFWPDHGQTGQTPSDTQA